MGQIPLKERSTERETTPGRERRGIGFSPWAGTGQEKAPANAEATLKNVGERIQGSDHAAGILQAAQLFDLDDDRIAVLHPDLRVAAQADAVRRAGENDVARLKGEGS